MSVQLDLPLNPGYITLDFFAGGGGASLGMEFATGRPVDIAINHDPKALGMHRMNHPQTQHFRESVWDVDPIQACRGMHVKRAWLSPDCTHHSNARGCRPRDNNIRGLAWVAIRWMLEVRPEKLYLENVSEFRSWGPLNEVGKVIENRAGETFQAFIKIMTTGLAEDHPAFLECLNFLGVKEGSSKASRMAKGLGYEVDYRELRACDFGAPTTRSRFFLIARNDKLPISWPEARYGEPDSCAVQSGKLRPWINSSQTVDWSIPVPSIFNRSKDLVDKTKKRIAKGIDRLVLGDDYYRLGPEASGLCPSNPDDRKLSGFLKDYAIDRRVERKDGTYGFILKYYSQGGQWASLNEPMHTIPTKDRMALIYTKIESGQIVDVGLRMFEPHELFAAQSFVKDYIHTHYIDEDGEVRKLTKADSIRMCGNSVPPQLVAAIIRANEKNSPDRQSAA